jgi:hypothetical protein
VEGNPFDILEEDEAGSDEEFTEIFNIYTLFFVPLEIDARILEQFDRIWSVHVVPEEWFSSFVGVINTKEKQTYERLKVKLNCQVDTSGLFPSSSQSVIPSCMILSMSTLHRIVWK